VAYTINYNHITTSVETWIEIVQPGLMEDQITIELIEQYEVATPEEQYQMDEMMEEFDMVMTFDLPIEDFGTEEMELDMPMEINTIGMMMEDYQEGALSFEEVMIEIDEMVEDIQEIGGEIEVTMPDLEKNPTEMIAEMPSEDLQVNEYPEEVDVSESSTESQQSVSVEKVEEKPDVSTNDTTDTTDSPQVTEEVEEEAEPQEKEVANKDVETKKVEQKEPKKVEVTKTQINKQKKANEILATIQSQYDPVAQLTTIALVTALGPDIQQYQQQDIVQQMQWYVTEEIYTDQTVFDPLGDYISVRSNLQMERMIQQQYE
jgi:hypothetical protein